MNIEESAGYKSLLAAVEKDESDKHSLGHNYRKTMQWAIDRAKQYAEATGLDCGEVLTAWELGRSYWYMNYYQECNQPPIEGGAIRVFENSEAVRASIGDKGFRCPNCKGVSKSHEQCDSGMTVDGKECNWKVFGLLDIGSARVFMKDDMRVYKLFKPVAWEDEKGGE